MSEELKYNPGEMLKQEGIKDHFGHCFEISKIKDDDLIPVGGESIFSDEVGIKVEADFEKFEEFFQEVHDLVDNFNLPELKKWLIAQDININEKLFAELVAFTSKFQKKYTNNSEGSQKRREIYNQEGKVKLSDIFEVNSAECAEIAALAQGYLQGTDFSSSYFSGDVLWNREQEFSGEHSFVVVRQSDKIYIFDPTNPTNTTQGKFPSIYSVEANFDEEMGKGQKVFVTGQNILNKKEAFFGVNDRTNINTEEHIV